MIKFLVGNRRALYDFKIKRKLEAGVELTGPEVKSAKGRKVDLTGSFVKVKDGEAFLFGMRLAPYPPAAQRDYEAKRTRRLLLKKRELRALDGYLNRKGFAAVPLKLYLKRGLVKVEVGLGVGKKKADRRAGLKKRNLEREMEKNLKDRWYR